MATPKTTVQPARFRRRCAEVDGVKWTGDNEHDLITFCGVGNFEALEECDDDPEATAAVRESAHGTWVLMYTGDWVVKDATGGRGRLFERVGDAATTKPALVDFKEIDSLDLYPTNQDGVTSALAPPRPPGWGTPVDAHQPTADMDRWRAACQARPGMAVSPPVTAPIRPRMGRDSDEDRHRILDQGGPGLRQAVGQGIEPDQKPATRVAPHDPPTDVVALAASRAYEPIRPPRWWARLTTRTTR